MLPKIVPGRAAPPSPVMFHVRLLIEANHIEFNNVDPKYIRIRGASQAKRARF
jgi:hypothetical protein